MKYAQKCDGCKQNQLWIIVGNLIAREGATVTVNRKKIRPKSDPPPPDISKSGKSKSKESTDRDTCECVQKLHTECFTVKSNETDDETPP